MMYSRRFDALKWYQILLQKNVARAGADTVKLIWPEQSRYCSELSQYRYHFSVGNYWHVPVKEGIKTVPISGLYKHDAGDNEREKFRYRYGIGKITELYTGI
jgi:hypothetical protein